MAKKRTLRPTCKHGELVDPRFPCEFCAAEAGVVAWPSDFDSEEWLVAAIRAKLLTPAQREALYDVNLSIEDCLNGRYGTDPAQNAVVAALYDDWNKKIGRREFGS